MAENSNIEWTDHTFNPWIGCQKVSAACDNCYAEAWDNRFHGGRWGPRAPRTRTAPDNWKKPLKWDREAKADDVKRFVFCASLADVFDNAVPASWRGDLFDLIKRTPNLVWLLLTKRPQNIVRMLPQDWGKGYPNVWLGATVANQEDAERNITELLFPLAAKRFLSIEPMLGPVDLRNIDIGDGELDCLHAEDWSVAIEQYPKTSDDWEYDFEDDYGQRPSGLTGPMFEPIDWVICGGESGPNARPMHPDWARSLRDQCQAAGVPFLFKQWGEWCPGEFRSPPEIRFQNNEEYDANTLPDFNAGNHPDWDDGLGFCLDHSHSVFRKMGKKRSGRLLDGVEHNGRPAP